MEVELGWAFFSLVKYLYHLTLVFILLIKILKQTSFKIIKYGGLPRPLSWPPNGRGLGVEEPLTRRLG